MKKILIANRGEIAVRIIRSAREMGIQTVAVHSECDAESLHVKLADESVCIGGNRAKDSYLNVVQLMSACDVSGADAIHPGYGFLSENCDFAAVVQECGINFIGPSIEAMKSMGSKVNSREIVQKAGVPVTPGTKALKDPEEALEAAERIEYPVLLKASHGGGGRGMRVVRKKEELKANYESAQNESQAAFGSGELFLEKYIERPLHIEIQVLADKHGNVIHLGERECSLQRRHQKIIEEAPSPRITEEVREKMGQAACNAAKAVNYFGLGTIEFLVDENLNFYFMEMNTRVQVEHPVTEEITGVDLIKEQIKIAQGEKLSLKQKDVELNGHSIEFRINAEDPNTFIPSPGTIQQLVLPGGRGVRIDTGIFQGSAIPPFYDSMVAKLIVHGKDREEATIIGKRALKEFIVEGIKTNIPLHLDILESKDFESLNFYTKWIEEVHLAKK